VYATTECPALRSPGFHYTLYLQGYEKNICIHSSIFTDFNIIIDLETKQRKIEMF
jgi:hypothetical protein